MVKLDSPSDAIAMWKGRRPQQGRHDMQEARMVAWSWLATAQGRTHTSHPVVTPEATDAVVMCQA